MPTSPAAEFARHLTSLAAMQARVAKNGYGRNSDSTEANMTWRYQQAERLARTDAVLDALDASPALAARWNRAERLYYGLPA